MYVLLCSVVLVALVCLWWFCAAEIRTRLCKRIARGVPQYSLLQQEHQKGEHQRSCSFMQFYCEVLGFEELQFEWAVLMRSSIDDEEPSMIGTV